MPLPGPSLLAVQPVRVSRGHLQLIPNVCAWLVCAITLMTSANRVRGGSAPLRSATVPGRWKALWAARYRDMIGPWSFLARARRLPSRSMPKGSQQAAGEKAECRQLSEAARATATAASGERGMALAERTCLFRPRRAQIWIIVEATDARSCR